MLTMPFETRMSTRRPRDGRGQLSTNGVRPLRCAATRQSLNMSAEVALRQYRVAHWLRLAQCAHFPGRENLNKPHVFVFPHIVFCLDCGSSNFIVPKAELQSIRERDFLWARAS